MKTANSELFTPKVWSVIVAIFLTIILNSSYCFAWRGMVVEKGSQKPIENVVIVRGWTKAKYFPPYATNYETYKIKETLSDADGRFFIIGIFKPFSPLIQHVYEEKSIVYKPGYKFKILDNRSDLIELTPIPTLLEERKKELKHIDENYGIDKNDTEKFRKIVNLEEEFLSTLRTLNKQFTRSGRTPYFVFKNADSKSSKNKYTICMDDYAQAPPKGVPDGMVHIVKTCPGKNIINYKHVYDLIAIIKNRNDDNVEIYKALRTIKKIRLTKATPYVIKLLQHPSPRIQETAIDVLKHFGHDFTKDEIRIFINALTIKGSRVLGIRSLRRIGPASIPSLIEFLQSKNNHDQETNNAAISALSLTNYPQAAEALKSLFTTGTEETKFEVGKSLRKLNDPEAIDFLIDLLKSSRQKIQIKTVSEIKKLGDSKATEELIDLLNTENIILKKEVVRALGMIGNSQAVEPLCALLQSTDGTLQYDVVTALGLLRDPRSVEPLKEILQPGDNRHLQNLLVITLGLIKNNNALEILKNFLPYAIDTHRTLQAISEFKSKSTVYFLLNAYSYLSSKDYSSIGLALKNIGPIAVQPIIENLDSENIDMLCSLISALGSITDKRAIEPILSFIKDDRNKVRKYALAAIAKYKNPYYVNEIFEMLNDTNDDVRKIAAESLVNLGEASVDVLIKGLSDKNSYIRWKSVWCLGQMKSPRSFKYLVYSLQGDKETEVRWNAITSLGIIGENEVAVYLKELLNDKDEGISSQAKLMISEIQLYSGWWKEIREKNK